MTKLPGRLCDMLPENLHDARTAALGYALDRQMERLLTLRDRVLVLAAIPDLCEAFCDVLALTFSVDAYDNTFDLETKRALLANILDVHARKGTAHAVQMVVGAIHGGAEVVEWPEYGGEPFRFRIDVDARESREGAVDRADLMRVVNATKSVRSHLEQIRVRTDSVATVAIAALSSSRIKTQSRPNAGRPGGSAARVQVLTRSRTITRTSSIGVENYG